MAERGIQELRDQLKSLKGELDEATDPAQVVRLKDEMRRTAQEVKGAESQTNRLGASLGKVKAAIEAIGPAAIAAFAGLSATVRNTVRVADPATFQQFSLALRDLAGVVGQILAPVLQKITAVIRSVADYIVNLSPQTRRLIATVVSFTLALTAVIGVAYLLVKAINAVTAAAAAMNVTTGGFLIIVGAIVAAASALAAILGSAESRTAVFGDTFEKLGNVITNVGKALWPTVEAVGSLVSAIVGGLMGVVGDLLGLLGSLLGTLVELASYIVGPVLQAVAYILTGAFKLLFAAIRLVIGALQQVVNLIRYITGLPPLETPEKKRERRSSVGAGGRDVSIISGEELHRQMIVAGIRGSRGTQDPNARAEAQRERMITLLERNGRPRPEGWDRDQRRHS